MFIHTGPMSPNGNIKGLGTEAFFCSGKYTFAISMIEEQQICRKIFSGSEPEKVNNKNYFV